MQYKVFGRRSGLRVSEVALSAGKFGTGWGIGAGPAEARRIFDNYAEAGGNFIDTAGADQTGQSEVILADLLAADREHFVLSTKYTIGADPKSAAGLFQTDSSRRNMTQSVEASLKRLKTDFIDLYWVHLADGETPTEEVFSGLDDLVQSGKILYFGLSNFPAWRVARADLLAQMMGWTPAVGIQVRYSLAERSAERELMPMAEAIGLGATLSSPLGSGFLTGKCCRSLNQGHLTKLGVLIQAEKVGRETAILEAILAVARDMGATTTHVAIAWLLQRGRSSSTSMIPILGPRTWSQFNATLGGLTLQLSADQIALLDAVSAGPLGTPRKQIRARASALAADIGFPLNASSIPAA